MTREQLYRIAVGLATSHFLHMYTLSMAFGGVEPESAFEHWLTVCDFEMDDKFKSDVWKTFLHERLKNVKRN